MKVLSELRERRIVQIVLSYLAVGWALLEVTDQLSGRGVIPDLVYTLFLVWIIFGLIATILIGWHHGEKGKQEAPRSELIALGLLAVLALGSSGFVVRSDQVTRRTKEAAEFPLELRNVAVLYFKDYTDDPQLAYVADGLTEDLIRALSDVRDLDVLSKNATAQFRELDAPLDSIAQVLKVGTVVDGSVEKRGNQIEVSLQLVDGRSGTVVQRSKIKRPADELLAVRDSVVEHAATLLREWIGKEIRLRRSERGTTVREAWALVQRAENTRKAAEAAVNASGPVAGEVKFQEALKYLDQAQKLDATWVEPAIQKAAITYRRARLVATGGELEQSVKLLDQGLQYVQQALALVDKDPRALELRGTLKYFKWLLNVTSDADERGRLRSAARTDLEMAVGLDPSLASAHSTLSHMLYNEDLSSALVEARLAYEKDAYLEVANEVVWRLFYGNFDQANFTQAKEWCEKGQARFPSDFRFTYCELRLMASPAVDARDADPRHAWDLLVRLDSLTPAPKRPYEFARGEMAVGGVLARAGLPDSARAVLARAHNRVTAEIDPGYDLSEFEGVMRLLTGDKEAALELIRRTALANPDQGLKRGAPVPWMLRDLQDHPRFGELYTR